MLKQSSLWYPEEPEHRHPKRLDWHRCSPISPCWIVIFWYRICRVVMKYQRRNAYGEEISTWSETSVLTNHTLSYHPDSSPVTVGKDIHARFKCASRGNAAMTVYSLYEERGWTYTEPTNPMMEDAAFRPALLADVDAIVGLLYCWGR